MYHRKRFVLWPMWGNGLGKPFFLAITLSSVQVEWSTSPVSHSFKAHNCEQFQRMVHFGGWCRTVISIRKWSGQSFPREDSFYPSFTMVSVRGMAQLGEFSRFSNHGHAFSREESFSPSCTMISARGMAHLGEWSRLINQGQLFFCG
jgi:hypothetical protein